MGGVMSVGMVTEAMALQSSPVARPTCRWPPDTVYKSSYRKWPMHRDVDGDSTCSCLPYRQHAPCIGPSVHGFTSQALGVTLILPPFRPSRRTSPTSPAAPLSFRTSSGLVVLAREPGMMWNTHASVPLLSSSCERPALEGSVLGTSNDSVWVDSWRRISCCVKAEGGSEGSSGYGRQGMRLVVWRQGRCVGECVAPYYALHRFWPIAAHEFARSLALLFACRSTHLEADLLALVAVVVHTQNVALASGGLHILRQYGGRSETTAGTPSEAPYLTCTQGLGIRFPPRQVPCVVRLRMRLLPMPTTAAPIPAAPAAFYSSTPTSSTSIPVIRDPAAVDCVTAAPDPKPTAAAMPSSVVILVPHLHHVVDATAGGRHLQRSHVVKELGQRLIAQCLFHSMEARLGRRGGRGGLGRAADSRARSSGGGQDGKLSTNLTAALLTHSSCTETQ